MNVAIIGAGIAGLCSAKLLTEFGFNVTVFDKTPDVGGVWSRTRRYPGVTTQNNKGTYAFSDFPMPRDYPEWPSGEQVERYLAEYTRRFRLDEVIRLGTEVVSADLDEQAGRWTLTVRNVADGCTEEVVFDQLIVANGIFCDPFTPDYPGTPDFVRVGGQLCAASEFNELADAAGKDIVVVGYGKSACDIAESLSNVASSTTLVAREVTWKMPRKVAGFLNMKYILLTRFTEALFEHLDQRGLARFLTGRGRRFRNALLGSIGWIARRQLKFDKLGLVPKGPFEHIVRHAVSLATENFYEKVLAGSIDVRRDLTIAQLCEKDGRPTVILSDGSIVPADVVVCATGFLQRTPFLPDHLHRRLTDTDGNFMLYRQILPLDVPRLFFVGYGSSLLSPISAEAAAMWVVHYLAGIAELPSLEERRAFTEQRLRWMIERTQGKQARGTNIIPFQLRLIDEILDEVGINIGRWAKLRQWLLPVKPAAYQAASRKLHRRVERKSRSRTLLAAVPAIIGLVLVGLASPHISRADQSQGSPQIWSVGGADFEPSWTDQNGVLNDLSFYTPPDPLPPGRPGDLIRTEPSRVVFEPSGRVDFRGTGTRIMYRSTEAQGHPVAVTGTYIEPDNPWPGEGPRPLIAYAALPTGMGEQCAPSKLINQGIHASTSSGFDVMINLDQGFIGTLVARGFAVVVTDGVGMGVHGQNSPQFVNRVAAGTALIDAARAAMRLPGTSLDPHGPVAFWGWLSGGHAALAAAELADTYGPELNVVGAYAAAAPTDISVLVPVIDGNFLAGTTGWILRGMMAAYPETEQPIRDSLTPRGLEMLDNTGRQCLVQTGTDYMFRHLGGGPADAESGRFWFKHDIYEGVQMDPLKSLLQTMRLGVSKPNAPVYFNHNRWDSFAPYQTTLQTAREYCAMGADVTFWTNEQPPFLNKMAVNSLLPVVVDGERSIAWITDRFNRVPTTPNCGEL